MKKLVAGLVIGLTLGIAIPVGAHRDAGTSRHLYKHFHQVAHRVIDLEQIVVDMDAYIAKMDSELLYLRANFDPQGSYTGPISSGQIETSQVCAGQPARWTYPYYSESATLSC